MGDVSTIAFSDEEMAQALKRILFPENPDEPVLTNFAVLDGAVIPELFNHLYGDDPPEFFCLYSGDLEPDMAEVAPYLVELREGAPFTDWVLQNMFGVHWGIILRSPVEMAVLRKHLRTLLMVRDPYGRSLYFRYYDPRVLRSFVGIAEQEKISRIIGPAVLVVMEKEDKHGVTLLIRKEDGGFSVSNYKWTELPGSLHLAVPPLAEYGGRPDMLISSEEMDCFDDIAARDFRKRARSHFTETFPDDERVAKAEVLGEFIEKEIQAAAGKGMELEQDVIRYLQLSFQLGTDFPTRFPWAVTVLEESTLDPSEKMDRLWEHATEEFAADAANP